ncbi:hypothetical protein Fmac_018008 [Flemingia macrophylla]|uniref:phosphopantothenoylcysteine decarboxylase n=1 Tax=Flemingia macrophylla TaxID=520843 RepID=A0ABD1M3P4_9FABA
MMDCSSSGKAKSEAELEVERRPQIVLAACGCFAALNKFGSTCGCFMEWADLRAVVTNSASRIIDRSSFPEGVFVYFDKYEDHTRNSKGRPVLHVELFEWADILVIAPLSAHSLAMIAGGFCESLLTCIVRAWDYRKPIFVAPSMNHFLWKNPLTQQHCERIEKLGIFIIQPVSQRSARGEYEKGEMADPSEISSIVKRYYDNSKIQNNNVGGV